MRVVRLVLVLVAATSLTACLNSTTLVKVKPDGSGTVEQTTLINMAALKGMSGAQSSAPMTSREELERTRRELEEAREELRPRLEAAAGETRDALEASIEAIERLLERIEDALRDAR